MTFTDTALILSRRPFREHDRIYTLFGRRSGKIDAIAQGSRKKLSKLAGHLEPYREIEVMCASRKTVRIAQVFPCKAFVNSASSALHIAAAGCVGETVGAAVPFHHRDPRLYALTREAFAASFAARTKDEITLILGRFFVQLSIQLGYTPKMESCVLCHASASGPAFFFSVSRGGVLCASCAATDAPHSFHSLPTSVMPLFSAQNPSVFSAAPSSLHSFFTVAREFISYRLEYPIKSFGVFISLMSEL